MKDLVPAIEAFWPEAQGSLHVDAWREVNQVNGYRISVVPREAAANTSVEGADKLFFLNLGGYKEGEFDEFHYKLLVVAKDQGEAIAQAKQTAFYKHTGFKGAASHVDNKYGVDVDELHPVQDIISKELKEKYSIQIAADDSGVEDELHLGYFMLHKL